MTELSGGRVTVYETLLDRARRESLLRLKEEAIAWGATQVLNVRYETATIGNSSKQGVASLEVIVYGTAIR
ncbi:YbjQ family protein [Spirulina sp. 06S082]|uniref:YbjQ family protein n=1 Tax=Spirulina sp. 06S082 TaxID=3110248 RepID=UPI002B1F1504|nr:heavy metal-binding domain-containing protein [Spirulina sp. 06S082]MEA5470563.1 heavy metal-binding domain-containing protein [Spirulina sp. 06S082]